MTAIVLEDITVTAEPDRTMEPNDTVIPGAKFAPVITAVPPPPRGEDVGIVDESEGGDVDNTALAYVAKHTFVETQEILEMALSRPPDCSRGGIDVPSTTQSRPFHKKAPGTILPEEVVCVPTAWQ